MKMVGSLLKLYGNYMETIWKLYENNMERRKQYENGWKPFETIWKLYENNMERMWKGCGKDVKTIWK